MSIRFNRDTLVAAFAEIDRRALRDGKIVEIAVYGGAAIVLTLEGRPATRSVDAAIGNDAAWLRAEVQAIAEERGWPEGWLNDGVKGFLSDGDRDSGARILFATYPDELTPGLRVFVATPGYLFAMKCLAMRAGGIEASVDRQDIERLAEVLHIRPSPAFRPAGIRANLRPHELPLLRRRAGPRAHPIRRRAAAPGLERGGDRGNGAGGHHRRGRALRAHWGGGFADVAQGRAA